MDEWNNNLSPKEPNKQINPPNPFKPDKRLLFPVWCPFSKCRQNILTNQTCTGSSVTSQQHFEGKREI